MFQNKKSSALVKIKERLKFHSLKIYKFGYLYSGHIQTISKINNFYYG